MRYFTVEYRPTKWPDYLELYSFDGTYRGVKFHSEDDARCARLRGRAELDCVAIADGLLPRGSYLVSRAGAREVTEDPAASPNSGSDRQDLLGVVRLRFSISLVAARSEYINELRDAAARARDPVRAARYDRGVTIISRGK